MSHTGFASLLHFLQFPFYCYDLFPAFCSIFFILFLEFFFLHFRTTFFKALSIPPHTFRTPPRIQSSVQSQQGAASKERENQFNVRDHTTDYKWRRLCHRLRWTPRRHFPHGWECCGTPLPTPRDVLYLPSPCAPGNGHLHSH